jgi:hypothetical protein
MILWHRVVGLTLPPSDAKPFHQTVICFRDFGEETTKSNSNATNDWLLEARGRWSCQMKSEVEESEVDDSHGSNSSSDELQYYKLDP